MKLEYQENQPTTMSTKLVFFLIFVVNLSLGAETLLSVITLIKTVTKIV